MAPRLPIILSASMFAVLLGADVALDALSCPQIPIREHNVLLGVAVLVGAGGLYALGYRHGLDLGQRMRRVDPRPDEQVEVVVPMRRRA